MRNLKQFKDLLEDEMALTVSESKHSKHTLHDIKTGFEDMVRISGLDLDDIDFAYISGSYSRNQQTSYSDVDIECFSPTLPAEFQDTFKWDGLLISFSVYPTQTVRGEGKNIVDQSWAKSVFLSSKPIYDPNHRYEECAREFLREEVRVEDIDLPFSKHMRKVIEYRRKMLSALTLDDRIFYNYATSKFLENFALVKNILNNGEISSERGQFDILAERSLRHPDGLADQALALYAADITLGKSMVLSAGFLGEMVDAVQKVSLRPREIFNAETSHHGTTQKDCAFRFNII